PLACVLLGTIGGFRILLVERQFQTLTHTLTHAANTKADAHPCIQTSRAPQHTYRQPPGGIYSLEERFVRGRIFSVPSSIDVVIYTPSIEQYSFPQVPGGWLTRY